jgi:hypothetical protein
MLQKRALMEEGWLTSDAAFLSIFVLNDFCEAFCFFDLSGFSLSLF